MSEKILVGEEGYGVNGECLFVISHVENGYTVCQKITEGDEEYLDVEHPFFTLMLFESPPSKKYVDDIQKLRSEIAELVSQRKLEETRLHDIRANIARTEQMRKDVATTFPFLEDLVRVQKRELNYMVTGSSSFGYNVFTIEKGYEQGSFDEISIAEIELDRKTKRLSIKTKYSFFGTEEEASNYRRDKVIADIKAFNHQLHNGNSLEWLIREAVKAGVEIPPNILEERIKLNIKELEKRHKGYLDQAKQAEKELSELRNKLT